MNMVATRSSETSVHARSTRRHIPEDGILHSHRCENLKPYKIFLFHFKFFKSVFLVLGYKVSYRRLSDEFGGSGRKLQQYILIYFPALVHRE
jgi:hypothetical protein